MDRQILIMVILKLCLNAFFSSSVASALLFLPVLSDLSIENGRWNKRFFNLVSSFMVIAVMITQLFILVIESRSSVKKSIEQSKEQLIHGFSELDGYIGEWMRVQKTAMDGLAGILMDPELDHSIGADQEIVELISLTQGYFEAFILYDSDMNILASVPSFNQFENLSKTFIETVKGNNFSQVYISPWGSPFLSTSIPISREKGKQDIFLTGYQRITALNDLLVKTKINRNHSITLLDKNGFVIATTKTLRSGLAQPVQEPGVTVDMGNGVTNWYPQHSFTKIQEFKKSKLMLKRPMGRNGWTTIMEYSNSALLDSLVRMTTRNMIIVVLCFLIINLMLVFISQRMIRILDQLIHLSASQMYGLEKRDSPWPESSIMEFSLFSQSLKEIMEHQSKAASLLHDQNEKLSEMNVALMKSEEYLRTTLNSIADGIVVIDDRKIITIINPVALNMIGLSISEVLNEDVNTILQFRDIYTGTLYKDPFSAVLLSGGIIEPSLRFTIGMNTTPILTLGAAPIRISLDDKIMGAVIVLRDITDEIKLEDQLRQSQKMEVVGQLAGGIAHDFNNLLGGIQGTVNMMELDLVGDASQQGNINRLLTLVKRASDLTMKLLSFSRKGAVSIVPMDIHTVLRETINLLEHTFSKEVLIKSELKAARSVIQGDSTEIQRLLMNLCLNSRDAMPEGGMIILRTKNIPQGSSVETLNGVYCLNSDFILLQIEDAGVGIDSDILPHIFEPFFTTKDLGQGSGLGLSAVYGSVLTHQGVMSIRTSEEEGTSFSLYFPLYSEE